MKRLKLTKLVSFPLEDAALRYELVPEEDRYAEGSSVRHTSASNMSATADPIYFCGPNITKSNSMGS